MIYHTDGRFHLYFRQQYTLPRECGGQPNHTYATLSSAFNYFKTAEVTALKDQETPEVRKRGKGKVPVLNL